MPENVRNVVKRGVVVAEQEASKGRTVGSRGAEEARRAILGPPSLWESSACQPSSSQGGGGRGKGRPTFWKPLSFAFTIKLSLSQSQFSFPNPFSEMRRKSNNELDITLNWNGFTFFFVNSNSFSVFCIILRMREPHLKTFYISRIEVAERQLFQSKILVAESTTAVVTGAWHCPVCRPNLKKACYPSLVLKFHLSNHD